jgi:PPOX class probable F420-dependent enzyme
VILNVVFSSQIINLLDGKNFASLSTVMPSGFPQVTPVWIDYNENHDLLVNTALGRAKERYTAINDKVGVSIFNMSNPYETVSMIGNVVEKTNDRYNHHFNKLSKKYLNLDKYPIDKPEEKRVILKIRPKKISYVSIPLSTYI